jgi:DHA2 family multidrug resistance protein
MSHAPASGANRLQGLPNAQLLFVGVLLGLANFMVVLDTTIANVAVPHIAGALAVSPAQGTWVITSYAVSEAITVPLAGWLVQRFGTVKVFIAALAGFAVCSVLCGLAPSFAALVALRVLQGFCGGPIMPASQTLLLGVFPPERSAQAISIWAMTSIFAPIFGPLFGGILSDGVGWSWVFYINVPVAALVGFGVLGLLRGRETPVRRVPVDFVGLGLLVVWVGSLQIMLDRGKELEWFASSTIVALAIAAGLGFVSFIIWELTAENPIVDLRVFRSRGFTVGVTITTLGFASFFASAVLIPLWLQTSMGYTATWAGRSSAMNGVLGVISAPIVGRLAGRFDLRKIITIGIGGMGLIAFWRSHLSTDVTFWGVAGTFLAQGAVIPFFFMAATVLTMQSVRPEQTASAAGFSNFLRTSGGAFATSIMTTYWDNTASSKRAELVGRLHDAPGVIAAMTARGMTPQQATNQLDQIIQAQAVMLSTDEVLFISSFVFALAIAVVWLAPRPNPATRATPVGH